MQPGEQQQCTQGSDQGEKHVRLGVPGIALRAEELDRPLSGREGHPPLDQLIERADGKGHADHQQIEHPAMGQVPSAQQGFPRQQRRNQTLHEVPQLVVGVAAQLEQLLHPETERHTRIGVGPTQNQHQRVGCDKHIEQLREWVAAVGGKQNRRGDQHRCHFQQPGRAIVWVYS